MTNPVPSSTHLVAALALVLGLAGPGRAATATPPKAARPKPPSASAATRPAPLGEDTGPSAATIDAHQTAMRHYVQGLYLETSGDVPGAIGEVGRAFAFEPKSPEIALKLADLSLQTGNARGGLDYARRAANLGETSGRARFLAGSALVALEQPAQAQAEFHASAAQDSTNSDTWQALGHLDDDLGLLDDAQVAYEHAYALDADDPDVTFRLGTVYARRERWAAADSLFARVEQMNPFQPGLFLTRGFVAERLGRNDEAVKDYRTHLHAYPNDDKARRRLVQALLKTDDYASAATEATSLVEQSPDDFEASRLLASLDLTLKKNDDAAAVVTDLRRHLPGQVEPAAFAVGVLMRVGKDQAARDEADRLTREAPGNSRAWLVAAEAYAAKEAGGRHSPEADARYAKARTALADSTGAWIELARSFTRTGRADEAAAVFQQATERDPKNPRLWLEVAYARERVKDIPGAEAAARQTLSFDPGNTQALNFLGYLFADHNVKLDQAVPLIQKALELDPDNPYYIDSLGWAYFRLGRLEEARGQLERAVRLGAEESEVLEHLGDVDLALDRKGEAKSNYTKALQLDPTRGELVKKLEALR
jgi:tetratricopeptide (TPR) repeat protein